MFLVIAFIKKPINLDLGFKKKAAQSFALITSEFYCMDIIEAAQLSNELEKLGFDCVCKKI